MSIIRKTFAFTWLLTLAMPVLFLIGLQVRQFYVQYEMMEKLEEEKLQTVLVPAQELNWVKKNKEVRIADELFDVKEWKIEDGIAILKGLYDYEERMIEKQLSAFCEDDTDKRASQIITLICSQSAILNGDRSSGFMIEEVTTYPFPYTPATHEIFLPVFVPPPQNNLFS